MTQPPGVAVPRCYRHGDRETYISCQRCGRAICPDCMRQASVGFQCPECVAEGARSVRPARTYAGGLVPARVGVVSMALIGINVVVFVAVLATGATSSEIYLQGGMLGEQSARFRAILPLDTVSDGAYWRMLTAAFLHAQVIHILFNMYALAIFGPLLEQLLGRLRFVGLYLAGALVASVAVYWLAPRSFTIGASGAVFALFGAAIVLLLRRGQDISSLLVLLAINLFITFAFPRISWQGHLGGLVTGLLFGLVFAYAPRRSRTLVQGAAFLAVGIGVVVATLLRTAALTG